MADKKIPVVINVSGRARKVCCKSSACSWCGEPFKGDDTAVILPNGQVLHAACDLERQIWIKSQKPPISP